MLLFIFSAVFSIVTSHEQAGCVPNLLALTAELTTPRFTENVIQSTERTIPANEIMAQVGVNRELHMTELRTRDSQRFKESELFQGEPADLIIGFDNSGNTQGHMYLSVRGENDVMYRYDGRLFFRPQDVTKDDFRLSPGMILRYKKIPEIHRRRLIALMESKMKIRRPTCVASAWSVLHEISHFASDSRLRPWFPGTFLKVFAQHGLVTEEGQRLTPEIYTINADAHDFWNNLPTWKRVWKFIIPVIMNPATWGLRDFKV